MQVGIALGTFTLPGGASAIGKEVRRIAKDADHARLAQLWVMDHFFQIPFNGPAEEPMLEGYALLAHLAAVTDRIELGVGVTGVPYRHPGVLLKTISTLDVLSGGRAWFGIGAAWNEQEARALGIPFPPLAERFERLEEVLQIADRMWSGDESPFVGRHYQLERPLNSPNTLRRPPVLIGGSGERKTLRLVARYADACNLFFGPPEELERKLEVLRRHCDDVGRPYDEITKTAMLSVTVAPGSNGRARAIHDLHQLASLGFDAAIVDLAEIHEPGAIDVLGEIADAVRSVVPTGREAAIAA